MLTEYEREMWQHVIDGMKKREEDTILKDGRGSMKACHACGQKLPLKVGDIVETKYEGKMVRGMVTGRASGQWVNLLLFDGRTLLALVPGMTRLHGYYRITERETL